MDPYVDQQYTAITEFRDFSGALTDPITVTFTKQAPDGTQTVITEDQLTRTSTGVWTYTTSEPVPGTYTWEGKGVGTVTARDLMRIRVRPGIT